MKQDNYFRFWCWHFLKVLCSPLFQKKNSILHVWRTPNLVNVYVRPIGWPYFQPLILFWYPVLPSHFPFAVHENFLLLLQFFNGLMFYCSFLESIKCKRCTDQAFFNWFYYFSEERRDEVWHFSFGHSAFLLKVKDNGFGSSFLIQSTA